MHGQEIKFKINPITYIVWFVLIVSDQTQFLLCSFVSAALHEASHIAAYLSYGAHIMSVEILPFGISATVGKTNVLSCRAESVCAFCGPLMNLFLSAVFLFLSGSMFIGCEFFIYCNISFFILNMLPVIPLDGGRIFYFSLLRRFSVDTSSKTVKIVSGITVFGILIFGVFLFFVSGYNISVLLIGCYLFIYILTSADSF